MVSGDTQGVGKIKEILILLAISLVAISSASASPVDVVLVVDSSGSMTYSDPDGMRLGEVAEWLDCLDSSSDRAALISWDDQADFIELFTFDYDRICERAAGIDSNGGSDIYGGLTAAILLLNKECRDDAQGVIVLITDGEGDYTYNGESPLEVACLKGYMVCIIALSPDDASATRLQYIASETGGTYKEVDSGIKESGGHTSEPQQEELPEFPTVAIPMMAMLGALAVVYRLRR